MTFLFQPKLHKKNGQILSLNFIYFTTITKQVCVPVVFLWEENAVPRGKPPVWLGDRMSISHADSRYWTRVAEVRGEHVTIAPARQPNSFNWNINSPMACLWKFFSKKKYRENLFLILTWIILWKETSDLCYNCQYLPGSQSQRSQSIMCNTRISRNLPSPNKSIKEY